MNFVLESILIFVFLSLGGSQGERDSICNLEANSGNCSANTQKVEIRYFYSTLNNKCTTFPYCGGEGGNDNKFLTEQECNEKCAKEIPLEWQKIKTAHKEKKCYLKGKDYQIGEKIEENITKKDACLENCFCKEGFEEDTLKFNCPINDCFGPRQGQNCVPIYKENSGGCCPEYVCEPEKKKMKKCEYEGEFYVENQRIYLDDYPCFKCHCNELIEKGAGSCTEIDCGLEARYQDRITLGCSPVYYNNTKGLSSCCPIDWKCPKLD